jgi:integrase
MDSAAPTYAATKDLKLTADRLGHTSVRMVDTVYVELYKEERSRAAAEIDRLVDESRARPVARTWHEGDAEGSA